jgi:F420H(2)-dependent quinone reductase
VRNALLRYREITDVVVSNEANSATFWRSQEDAPAAYGRTRRRVVPREATAGERERLWRRFAAMSPVERYQEKTRRRIPVVVHPPAPAQR